MKTDEEVLAAISQCEAAQLSDNVKLCPMYSEDEDLYCHDCTCRDAFNWFLKS